MNIVLTGLRGSGKTKLGKILKERLGWKMIDIDREIEKAERNVIPEIVQEEGWNYFRKKENEAVERIAESCDSTIISTGGGTIINKQNAQNLKKNGLIIYLHRSAADCTKYLEGNKNRPPLTKEKTLLKEMEKLYKDRDAIYKKTAEIIYERSDDLEKDADEIVDQILGRILQP